MEKMILGLSMSDRVSNTEVGIRNGVTDVVTRNFFVAKASH